MNSINTNMSAMAAQQNMQKQNKELDDAMARLSSGLRINSAADDAAGSAIASKMEAQVRSLDVAIRNSYDAISMTQTAEGALGEMENILQRVRELSVQAANSTLSVTDREMIQSEVDALVNELDAISNNTHFNNVKLLDGSNADVVFQIGMNASDSLKVNLQNTDSLSLGLSGSTGVTSLTSSRMLKTTYNLTPIAASDIKLNGFDAFASDFGENLSDAATNTAKTIADKINLNTGTHGAQANAFNTFTSEAMGTFNMTADFTINSATVSRASSYSELVGNINEAVSGVTAALNSDNSITLSNKTGADIIINGGATVGFTSSAETFTGFIELFNLDGSEVTIEAGSVKNGYTGGAGTLADVQALGFNEFSTGGILESDTVSGTALQSNEVKINDVLIGSSLTGGANHIAEAINEKTAQHGVTANAKNELEVTFDYSANPTTNTDFKINGQSVDFSNATGAAAVVTAVNNASIGDIRASANADGTVKFTSESGVDIILANSDNDMMVSAKDIHGKSITNGFSNGTYDLDALLDNFTVVAAANQAIDTSSSTIIGEVVNSRVVMTQHATTDMTSGTAKLKVFGTDTAGNAISEELTFTNPSDTFDQIQGNTIFHTITSLMVSGTGVAANIDVGLNGNATTDTLRAAATGPAAANGVASNLRNNTDINGFVTITNSANNTAGYTITGTGFNGETITENITSVSTTTVTGKTLFKSVTEVKALADTTTNSNTLAVGTTTHSASAIASMSASTAAGTVDISASTALANLNGAVVTLSSAGDYSTASNNVTFTVTGTDAFGSAVSEDILYAGDNIELHGTTKFNSITSIVTDKALQAGATMEIGLALNGDRVEALGNVTLQNGDNSPIKIDAIGTDSIENGINSTGTVETILQKIGVKNQSQSFEVQGQGVSVSTEAQASSSLSKIDKAIDQLSLFRSSFGAVENRIDASINNLTTLKVNTEAAKSRIQDADFAAETSKMTKSQILSQAATSMLAQANASKQNLLALLQG